MKLNRFATMMLGTILTCGAVWAGDTESSLNRITEEARRARTEALEISTLLKNRTPDLAKVQEKMQVLTAHANALTEHLKAFEAENTRLSVNQTEDLEKLRTAVQLVNIFVSNKSELLAKGDAKKDRAILRAKAEGIAKRAELVEQSTARLRG